MVGIVVVSHSRALATAALALALEMVRDAPPPIALAAGLDDGQGGDRFGSDAVRIAEAIQEADDGSGVVVLMDLGSAVLSAELALELLDDRARSRVVLCPAPLVEGLVAAAVTAAGGAARQEVAAEAARALLAKQEQLAPSSSPAPAPSPENAAAVCTRFVLRLPHGLHARPAARLVQVARAWDAEVRLRNTTTGSGWAPAGSLSRLAALGALRGHELEVSASGAEAASALDAVLALADRDFDEPPDLDEAPATSPVAAPILRQGLLTGLPASPGIAIGPAWQARPAAIDVPDLRSADPVAEERELRQALDAARRGITGHRARTAREVGAVAAAVFDAHLLLVEDPALLADVRARIRGGRAAASAWAAAAGALADELAALPDAYQRARAADVRAVRDAVLRLLLRLPDVGLPGRDGVLLAEDLSPADVAHLDADRVSGVVLAGAGPTAHSSILLRGKGIPAVVGVGAAVLGIADGTTVAVDAAEGQVFVEPAEGVVASLRSKAARAARARGEALARAGTPAATRGGRQVVVGANIGSLEEARTARASGADCAGLVRTEVLFLGRADPPDVEEQVATYLALAEALDGRRLTLRTLDVGADKPLPYLPASPEANPFLGVRGLRLSLTRPELFRCQLLAAVRVAHSTPVSLLLPMVTTLEEVFAAHRLVDEVIAAEHRGRPDGLRFGIMVEVPAAALRAATLAPHVDFFSIGTNDLTSYTLAAERGNAAVATLADPLDPAVLALISAVCRGAAAADVAVCGELAASEEAVPLLLGLGVRELSVSPRAVPGIKDAVRHVDDIAATRLADRALAAPSATAVRALLRDHPSAIMHFSGG